MFKHSLIALAALSAGLVGISGTHASAFTAAPQPVVRSNDTSLLMDVRHRSGGSYGSYGGSYHGSRNSCNSWNNTCGHHNRYNHNNSYYGSPGWVLGGIGLGYGLAYGSGHYDNGYYGGSYEGGGYGNRHVAWCLSRYRSYNPRSNTWVSYSGRVRQCYSPYNS